MDIEDEANALLAEEISNIIKSESRLSQILGDKYSQFVKARSKTEEARSERKWPKAMRSMWKPGSIAERFNDFTDYCEWCEENNEEVGV